MRIRLTICCWILICDKMITWCNNRKFSWSSFLITCQLSMEFAYRSERNFCHSTCRSIVCDIDTQKSSIRQCSRSTSHKTWASCICRVCSSIKGTQWLLLQWRSGNLSLSLDSFHRLVRTYKYHECTTRNQSDSNSHKALLLFQGTCQCNWGRYGPLETLLRSKKSSISAKKCRLVFQLIWPSLNKNSEINSKPIIILGYYSVLG